MPFYHVFSFHRVTRVSSITLLVHWSIGPLVHWSTGPLVHWSIGPLVHWTIGPLDHLTIGPFDHWSIGPLIECQMSKVNNVKFLSERISGVPPVIFFVASGQNVGKSFKLDHHLDVSLPNFKMLVNIKDMILQI